MTDTEAVNYYATIAAKLERVAREIAAVQSLHRETTDRLKTLAGAIRDDMAAPNDLFDADCRWDG